MSALYNYDLQQTGKIAWFQRLPPNKSVRKALFVCIIVTMIHISTVVIHRCAKVAGQLRQKSAT